MHHTAETKASRSAKKALTFSFCTKNLEINFALIPSSQFPERSHSKCVLCWSRDAIKLHTSLHQSTDKKDKLPWEEQQRCKTVTYQMITSPHKTCKMWQIPVLPWISLLFPGTSPSPSPHRSNINHSKQMLEKNKSHTICFLLRGLKSFFPVLDSVYPYLRPR